MTSPEEEEKQFKALLQENTITYRKKTFVFWSLALIAVFFTMLIVGISADSTFNHATITFTPNSTVPATQ